MSLKNTLVAVFCALLCVGAYALPLKEITVSDLTLEEKIHLLSCDMGIERLGVPQSFYSEGMHGVAYGGPSDWGAYKPLPTTSFPEAYGLGETWDPELLQRMGAWISLEQRYYFQNPVYDRAGLILWGPNVDLGRDPRWGRTNECYGEDPYLIAELAKGYVRGAQGPDPEHWSSATMLKHFLANSYENGRHDVSSDFSGRLLREYYTYPFYKVVTEGGNRAFMTAYNMVNGIVSTIHPAVRELALGEWSPEMIFCTDQDGMRRLTDDYHLYETRAEAAAAIVKSGTTQFLSDHKEDSQAALHEALEQGLLTEADLDEAVSRNLGIMRRLGLLGGPDPYASIGRDGAPVPCTTPEAAALCREVTDKSIVLLKNNGILPLNTANIKKIAVIGPHADEVQQDWYGGLRPYTVSILEGIREAAGEGAEVFFENKDFGGKGARLASECDVVIAVFGNNPAPAADEDGGIQAGWGKCDYVSDGMEEADRQSLTFSEEDVLKLLYRANPNTILILNSSFPYAINWSQEHLAAILHCNHGSMEQGHGVADVLFGLYNPAGRTTQTWPRSIEDLPDIADYDITKGRTYMYSRATPLYPFGHGLSYSSFKYSGLKLEKTPEGGFELSFDLTNVSAVDGEEVAQLYLQYPRSRVQRPLKQLRGFRRIMVKAGETVRVTMAISQEDMSYWDEAQHRWTLEKGRVRFLVGASSADIRLRRTKRVGR